MLFMCKNIFDRFQCAINFQVHCYHAVNGTAILFSFQVI